MSTFNVYELVEFINQNQPNRVFTDYKIEEESPKETAFEWVRFPIEWKNKIQLSLVYQGEAKEEDGECVATAYEATDALVSSTCYTDGFVTLDNVVLTDEDGDEIAPSIFEDWLEMYYEGDFWDELKDVYEVHVENAWQSAENTMDGIHRSGC